VPHSILRYLTLLFKDAILQYDHIFHIQWCDACDIQLGAVIFLLNGMPVAHYSRKLTKPKQKISGRIFLDDFNIQFHPIKDETNTLTDARSVSPLMRGRTPWRRLRQQHSNSKFFLSKIFHITFFNRYKHKFERQQTILAMKQMQIAKQFKLPGYPDIQTITSISSLLTLFFSIIL
jgi:hypothetical protein